MESRLCANMKRHRATKLIGIIGIAGGLAILLAFPTEIIRAAIPTIKVPGPYPYETPVQVPAPPPVSDSSPLPSPAPSLYLESSPRSRLPRIAIHEQQMPACRSRRKQCARQHSNTME